METMTTKEFAQQMKIDYRTALNWLRAGIVPGAKLIETPGSGYWDIPSSATAMTRPKTGPKKAQVA